MRGFWHRDERHETEDALRRSRPQPRVEFVETLVRQMRGEPRRAAGWTWSRASFAVALLTFMLGSFLSFGGLSYAAGGVSSAVDAVERVIVDRQPLVRDGSSAADQYPRAEPVEEVVEVEAGVEEIAPVEVSALPFTGLPLLGTAVVGFAFLGLGVALRRVESRKRR